MLKEHLLPTSFAPSQRAPSASPRSDWAIALTGETARPHSQTQVAAALLAYLSRRLKISDLSYSQSPIEFAEGWETYTYRFELHSGRSLPPRLSRPLVARIYSSSKGLPRARHEFAVLQHLLELKYPLAEPLFLEESCSLFGGPFLIREMAPGETLFRTLLRRPRKLWHAPGRMAETHGRLHQLPPKGFPSPPGSLLSRSFEEMAEIIRTFQLKGTEEGLEWLVANRPASPVNPCILHLDFHPMNLIQYENRPLVVLDWTEADVGDHHADLGTTIMLMDCVTPGKLAVHERLATWVGRFFLKPWYLRAYERQVAVDEAKLSYYRAWAALRRFCRYSRWLHAGPISNGYKPSVLQHIGHDQLRILEEYFKHWSGRRVHPAPSTRSQR